MPITLDKNDAPQLASAVIDVFKKLPNTYTDEKLKTLFTPDNPENQKLIQEAIEGIKKLGSAKINPRGSYIKISTFLHQAIPNKAVLEKLFPVFLEGDFKDLSKATGTDFAARQTANKAVLAAATAISTQLSAALGAAGKLNDALTAAEAAAKTAAPAGAVPAAGAVQPAVAEAFIRSFDLSKRLYEAGFITRSEYTAKLLETKRLLKEADEPAAIPPGTAQPNAPATGTPPAAAGGGAPDPAAAAGGATGTPPVAGGTAPAPAAATPATAATPVALDARKKLGEFVAGMGPNGLGQEVLTLVQKIQAAWTKYGQEKLIAESHRRLVKAQVKHKILREAKRQGVKKEMLNEFLLAMLGGLIAAVSGWIGKKFGEWFKGGAAVTVVPVGPGVGVDHDKEIDALLAQIAAAESGYQGPDGEHGPDGKPFDRTKSLASVDGLGNQITSAQGRWTALIASCPDGTAAAAAYPDPSGKAVVDALKAVLALNVDMAPLVAALKNMSTYLSS